MALVIKIERKGLIPGITARQAQQITRNALKRIAGLWHYRYSQDHFTNAGARKYRYQKRKGKEIYTGRILRKGGRALAGSGLPLVKSGETRRKAKQKTVRGTFRKATVSSPLGHLNQYKPAGFAAGQLRYEYTTVLKEEERALARDTELFLRSSFSKKKTNIQIDTFSLPPGSLAG